MVIGKARTGAGSNKSLQKMVETEIEEMLSCSLSVTQLSYPLKGTFFAALALTSHQEYCGVRPCVTTTLWIL